MPLYRESSDDSIILSTAAESCEAWGKPEEAEEWRAKLPVEEDTEKQSSAAAKIGNRIDSPVLQNAKPLLSKDLPEAANSAYKPAYKQNRKITPCACQAAMGPPQTDEFPVNCD
jgi:hypothetical protein